MKQTLRLAIGQVNPSVGDLAGNCELIWEYIGKARSMGADILTFPELVITGYPPEDLLLRESFIDDNLNAVKRVANTVHDMVVIVGFVDRVKKDLYNAAAVMYNGKIVKVYHKIFLPNYGVFDEKRYFKNGDDPMVFSIGDITFGVNICEDIWHDDGPLAAQAAAGASLILNINCSPYYAGKIKEREDVVKRQAIKNHVVVSYTNLVGGQDELVFDGRSMIVGSSGEILYRAAAFKEDLSTVDIALPEHKIKKSKNALKMAEEFKGRAKPPIIKKDIVRLDPSQEMYEALVLGLGDYVRKNDFNKVALGLSGGIDSSLVATVAADALGKENVVGVFMPTRYSSLESERDARELANNLGIRYISISIEHIFKIYLMTLEPHFAGTPRGIAEENLQARIRGNILMALSNKFGWLVLTTGNKSEVSTGYATLYGDMAGGFGVIKDVPKMLVYKLSRYRNSIGNVIPEPVFVKAPMAELKPDQKDSDTLPPYEKLDPILKSYVEDDQDLNSLLSLGFDKTTVHKVLNMVDKSEYKRRQAPPGIKITPKAFGKDRRMPITNKYKY